MNNARFEEAVEHAIARNTVAMSQDSERDVIRKACVTRALANNFGRDYEEWLHGFDWTIGGHQEKYIKVCKDFEQEYDLRQSLILTVLAIETLFELKCSKPDLISKINNMLEKYYSMVKVRLD